MGKLFTLVRNENLKIRKKKSLWIMLAILLLVSFGFSALLGFVFNAGNMMESTFPLSQVCDNQLEYYRELQANGEGDAREISYYIAYNTCLKEIGATWSDWRYTTDAVTLYAEAVANGETEAAASLRKIIDENDYAAFYREKLAEAELIYASDEKMREAAGWAYRYCLENDVEPSDGNWRYTMACAVSSQMVLQYQLEQQQAAGIDVGEKLTESKDRITLMAYQLEHDLPYNPGDSFQQSLTGALLYGDEMPSSGFWNSMVTQISMLTSLIGIFMVVIAGNIVATEFQKGTVKFLLITPARRWKILLSKYIAVLLHGLFFLVVAMLSAILFGMLFSGASEAFLPSLSIRGGAVVRSSPYLTLFARYLLASVRLVVMATLAFALSSLFRSPAVAVVVSAAALFGGNLITNILALFGMDWARYLIFTNMDLESIRNGATLFPHQSLATAVVIIVLHMVVFLWTAFDGFTRREV